MVKISALAPRDRGHTPLIRVTLQHQSSHLSWWETLVRSNIGAVKQTLAYNTALAESEKEKGGKPGLALASIGDRLVGGCAFEVVPSRTVPLIRIEDGPLTVDPCMGSKITESIITTIMRLNPGIFGPSISVKDSLRRIKPETARAAGLHTYVDCNFQVNLMKTEDELWRSLPKTARRGVRTAVKEGYNVVTDAGDLLEAFGGILRESLERGGRRYWHDSLLVAIRKHLFQVGLARLYVALIGNAVAAGVLVLCDPNKQRLYYYLAGSSAKHRGLWAGDLLVWEIIKRGALEGYSYLDMEGVSCSPKPGTKADGLFRFKSKWGGTFRQRYYHASLAYLLYEKLTELRGASYLIPTAVRIARMVGTSRR